MNQIMIITIHQIFPTVRLKATNFKLKKTAISFNWLIEMYLINFEMSTHNRKMQGRRVILMGLSECRRAYIYCTVEKRHCQTALVNPKHWTTMKSSLVGEPFVEWLQKHGEQPLLSILISPSLRAESNRSNIQRSKATNDSTMLALRWPIWSRTAETPSRNKLASIKSHPAVSCTKDVTTKIF